MKKSVVTALVMLLAISSAHAISRHSANNLACDAIQRILEREKQAILRYPSANNPNIYVFDRYVADPRFCAGGESGRMSTVRSKDNNACPVLRCYPYSTGGGR